MSKRAKLKEHIHTLDEIGNIMTAMKNLALIEINKVTKYISTQERALKTIRAVGRDFFYFYPDLLTSIQTNASPIYILIGSERGFCGGFNDYIIEALTHLDVLKDDSKFIVVGHKLAMKMVDDNRIVQVIEGPNAAEEIPNIILQLVNALETISTNNTLQPGYWTIISCEENQNKINTTMLQPFLEFKNKITQSFKISSLLNLTPLDFLLEFINQYLFSVLYFTLYKSFITENYQRVHHLDSALKRLENKTIDLTRHFNLLRQEEITEEIQVIMISAMAILEEVENDAKLT